MCYTTTKVDIAHILGGQTNGQTVTELSHHNNYTHSFVNSCAIAHQSTCAAHSMIAHDMAAVNSYFADEIIGK